MKDTLILLSKSFPHKAEETFLLPEINVLSKKFKRIFIVPLIQPEKNAEKLFDLPSNCEVIQLKNGITSKAFFLFFFNYLFVELFRNFNYAGIFGKLRYNFAVFNQAHGRSLELELFLKEQKIDPQTSVFYSYWLNEQALSLILLKRRVPIYAIGRGHGYDVFPEQALYGYNPFQASIVKGLDKILVVSKKGEEHLHSKYPSEAKKTFASYLGTPEHENIAPEPGQELIIISCAHIREVKGVHRVAEVLGESGLECIWIHLGGYSDTLYKTKVDTAVAEAKAKNSKLKVEFLGNRKTKDLMQFYASSEASFFISMSRNEGLPVAMMEAISFGLPLFATAVGGCKEIAVEEVSGKCVAPEMKNSEIAKELQLFVKEIHDKKYDRTKIRNFWEQNFSATNNYERLYKDHLS